MYAHQITLVYNCQADAVAQYIADVQTYKHPFSHIPYTPQQANEWWDQCLKDHPWTDTEQSKRTC